MTKQEAKSILQKITINPSLADQFTEKEIEELEHIAFKNVADITSCGEENPCKE